MCSLVEALSAPPLLQTLVLRAACAISAPPLLHAQMLRAAQRGRDPGGGAGPGGGAHGDAAAV